MYVSKILFSYIFLVLLVLNCIKYTYIVDKIWNLEKFLSVTQNIHKLNLWVF